MAAQPMFFALRQVSRDTRRTYSAPYMPTNSSYLWLLDRKEQKMPRGDKQQIMTYPVVLPSEEELARFNTIASPLLEQIYSNRAENKRLSILRDTLLPKLMSGEIDVSAVQL